MLSPFPSFMTRLMFHRFHSFHEPTVSDSPAELSCASLGECFFVIFNKFIIFKEPFVFLPEWSSFMFVNFHSSHLPSQSYRGERFRIFIAIWFALPGDSQPALSAGLIINTFASELTLRLCPESEVPDK